MFNLATTVTNLQALTINIPTTDQYWIAGTLTTSTQVSSATQGAGGGAGTGTGGTTVDSQVVVTIKQNGSTIYTGQTGALGFTLPAVQCTAGDVITITPSSSLAQDQQPQAIKMTVNVSEGPI
jgi:hypothetical protein